MRVPDLLAVRGHLVLDGGLATELELRGHDLDHALWSARLLATAPEAIRAVHRDFYLAGADCATAATYQASFVGFAAAGHSRDEALAFFQLAVRLAHEARASVPDSEHRVVAASVGPFGAARADGSEYHGDYGVTQAELRSFHTQRWDVLCNAGADVLACETIPSRAEAAVLTDLVAATPAVDAWLSFACRDGAHLGDGTPIEEVVWPAADVANIVAVGVNCTAPRYVSELIERVQASAPDKPVIAYPNSGETWDARRHAWSGDREAAGFGNAAREWHAHGARLVGGCCRTGPDHVEAVHRALAGL